MVRFFKVQAIFPYISISESPHLFVSKSLSPSVTESSQPHTTLTASTVKVMALNVIPTLPFKT